MARVSEPADPQDLPGRFSFIGLPVAGVQVDHQTALTIAAVWECVRIISETVGLLPWRHFERTSVDGRIRRRLQAESDLDFLLHTRPNDELPALYFKEALEAHALLWGNGYAEIERPIGLTSGPPAALHLMTPDQVEKKRTEAGALYFEITNSSGLVTNELAPDQVFHVRGLSWDGHVGYDLIKLARETLSTTKATDQFTSAFFGNGAHLGGVIQHKDGKKGLGEEGVKNLLASFNKRFRGARNAYKTNYLDAGMEFKEVGVNPNDAQLLEARRFNVLDVARWFRMPPHKLAHLDQSIKANIEAQGIEFVTDTIQPWVTRWEQEADFKFFDPAERGSQFTKMDLNALMRGDSKARGEFYKIMFSIGAFSINEVRELEDKDSIGEVGDLRLVPMNMVSVDEANRTGSTGMTRTRSTDAHISVFEEVTNRMARKESYAILRRKEQSTDEFKNFVGGFYTLHSRQLTQALLRPAFALAEFFGEDIDQLALGEAIERVVETQCQDASRRVIALHESGDLEGYGESVEARAVGTAFDIASMVTRLINDKERHDA